MTARAWLHLGLVVLLLATSLVLPAAGAPVAEDAGGRGAGPAPHHYTHDVQVARAALVSASTPRVGGGALVAAPLVGVQAIPSLSVREERATRSVTPRKSDPEAPGTGAAVR